MEVSRQLRTLSSISRTVDPGLAALGAALSRRADEIVEALSQPGEGSVRFDPRAERDFAEAAKLATRTVGDWLAGVGAEPFEESGFGAAAVFGRLAAESAAPLDELTRRCLRWRDFTVEVISEEGEDLGLAPGLVTTASEMIRRSSDVTLVRMSESFETVHRQVQEELTQRQVELAFQATHDALTGLPNRSLILDRLGQMLLRARRGGIPVSVLFLDLDNFKSVNDSLGHHVGDELLCKVAERLGKALRESDTLGRLGGDEFVVAAEPASAGDAPDTIARRLVAALREPFELEGSPAAQLRVTASIGVASGFGEEPEELLRNADLAMYRAKWSGKNRYLVFAPEMHTGEQTLPGLEREIERAYAEQRFSLAFQPCFDLTDMRVTGLEALLRYEHPVRGPVTASELLPLLEESGLLVDIGRWVLEEACRMGAAWHASGYGIGVTVNLSATQLEDDRLLDDIVRALSKSGLPASALSLDIPESALMIDLEAMHKLLLALKNLGVRLTVDDFGQSYTSIAQLRHLPVDLLKIDGSFVVRLLDNDDGEEVVHSLLGLARALGFETVAKGIERERQLVQLRDEHCLTGQGFLLSKPLPPGEIESFLSGWGPGFVSMPLEPATGLEPGQLG